MNLLLVHWYSWKLNAASALGRMCHLEKNAIHLAALQHIVTSKCHPSISSWFSSGNYYRARKDRYLSQESYVPGGVLGCPGRTHIFSGCSTRTLIHNREAGGRHTPLCFWAPPWLKTKKRLTDKPSNHSQPGLPSVPLATCPRDKSCFRKAFLASNTCVKLMVSFVKADPSPSFDGFSKCPQENHEKNPKNASILQNKNSWVHFKQRDKSSFGKEGSMCFTCNDNQKPIIPSEWLHWCLIQRCLRQSFMLEDRTSAL